MVFDNSGRTVLVAGGNLGIAEAFAASGAAVFVFSRSADKVAAAVEGMTAAGGRADGCAVDVRDMDTVRAAIGQCQETFGDLDVVVSGAAGNFPAYAKDISSNGFRAVMEIDLLGTHHVMTASWPHPRKPGASIINISAAQSYVAMVGQSHVGAAKAGVDMITRTLALEWGPEGVRINSVVPGPIADTEGLRRLLPTAEQLAERASTVPLQRLGSKQDVANLCLFLASDLASYITGTVIAVDGGSALNVSSRALERVLDATPARGGR